MLPDWDKVHGFTSVYATCLEHDSLLRSGLVIVLFKDELLRSQTS